jgi:hypothetical protein
MIRANLLRWVVSFGVSLGVLFSGYASALTFSTLTDSDLRCDTDGVVIAGWGVSPGAGEVQSVTLTEIAPACEGAELQVVVRQAGNPIADGRLTVAAGQTGANAATIALTQPGASTAAVSLSAASIEEASVLLHRGSEAATGIAESPCEFIGASIDGWDVDPLTAQVSGVRLRGISTACIGNEVLIELLDGGSVVRDGSVVLNAANTGSNVVTVPVTAVGGSNAVLTVAAAIPTSIQISVIGDDPVVPPPPGNETNTNPGANSGDGGDGPSSTSNTGSGNTQTSETLGTQSTSPQTTSPAPDALTDEVLGTRDEPSRLPSTGSYLPPSASIAGVPATLVAGALAVLAGLVVWCLPYWRRRHRDED